MNPKRSTLSWMIGALIVILAFLLFAPKLWTPGQKGKLQLAKIQIKELEGALQLFSMDTGRYPTTAEGLDALIHNPGSLMTWKGPYPSRPDFTIDPWDRSYVYRCPGQHGAYDLLSYGPDGIEGGKGEDDDVTSWEIPTAGR